MRTKEIGVRKDFLILVLLANFLSIPLSIYLIKEWLGNFAYQTGIQAGTFFLTFVFSVMIVLLTIVYYAQHLASVNPAHTLRQEQ